MISTRFHAWTDYLLPLGIAGLAASGRFPAPVRRIFQLGPVWHWGYTAVTHYEGGRWLLAAIGLGELALIAATSDRPRRTSMLGRQRRLPLLERA